LAILKRVCVITGASGTLGTAFIARYRTQYRIVAIHNQHGLPFASQNQSFLDPLDPDHALPENDDPVYAIRADLSREQAIEDLCLQVVTEFRNIDLLINAAVTGRWRPFLSPSALADAELGVRVNLLAPLRLAVGFARHCWRSCIQQNIRRRRNIVNLSSTAGVYVYPDQGQGLYSACKAALNFATYHLASEYWDIGVRVNAVAPNSFPGRVSIGRVLDQIRAFDGGDETGRVVTLDE
jgi:NAD(P)-dependent dehydrogenase (short-subunit alcohol dehydrogenase family)